MCSSITTKQTFIGQENEVRRTLLLGRHSTHSKEIHMPHKLNNFITTLTHCRLPITFIIIMVGIVMSISNHMDTRSHMAAQPDIITLSLPYKHKLNINKNMLDIRKMVAVEVMKGGK